MLNICLNYVKNKKEDSNDNNTYYLFEYQEEIQKISFYEKNIEPDNKVWTSIVHWKNDVTEKDYINLIIDYLELYKNNKCNVLNNIVFKKI